MNDLYQIETTVLVDHESASFHRRLKAGHVELSAAHFPKYLADRVCERLNQEQAGLCTFRAVPSK